MLNTLIVVDDDLPLPLPELPEAIHFQDYLRDYPKLNEPKTRIINLCDTSRYLSKGYYCSLLAEARRHQVLPNVKTINQLRMDEDGEFFWLMDSGLMALVPVTDKTTNKLVICLGIVDAPQWQKLATKIFLRYPAPLLELNIHRDSDQIRISLQRCNFSNLDEKTRSLLQEMSQDYRKLTFRKPSEDKRYRWNMAILVDPEEKVPPSNKGAISRFVKAANRLGISTQVLSADELINIELYDALFIRETTAIDHHTYRLACQAEASDLVVLDDPDSILRCCNKVYLHDAFNYQKVPSLKTRVIYDQTEQTLNELEKEFGFPLVLKMPESSFSRGVYKVDNAPLLKEKLDELLDNSALVLAQEYMFTDHDWRIGVLNGQALYACRYYMARNHWQIYNHNSKRNFSGAFDTLPTFEVPKAVLDAALKAAKIVGNGLYGVDVKVQGDKAYVLEVNDNPSIDQGVEDNYLGEELYIQVMAEFLRRMEKRGR